MKDNEYMITPEMLDAVTGGAITPDLIADIRKTITAFKEKGHTKEQGMAALQDYFGRFAPSGEFPAEFNEFLDIVDKSWDEV